MSSKKKSGSSKDSFYLADAKLIPRIRQYLSSHGRSKSFSVGTMARDLQSSYGDYNRKKRTAFLKSVERAYEIICKDEPSSEEADDFTSQLEKKHIASKKSGFRYSEDCIDAESDTTEKSFSSDNADYVMYKDTNAMNNFMTSIYQNNKKTEKSSNVMEVPNETNVSKPTLPTSTPCKRVSSPAPSPTLSVPSALTGMSSSSKTPSHPPSPHHKPSLTPLSTPVASSTPYIMNHSPIHMASNNKKSNTNRSYLADDVNLTKNKMVDGNRLKAYDSKRFSAHDVTPTQPNERRKNATSEVVSAVKASKDADIPSSKRPRLSERSRQEQPDKNTQSKEFGFQISSTTFADVGGNEQCLLDICKILVHMKHPEIHRQLGVTPPRGLLLHGPPGCGKTLLANAIAGELQLPFLKLAATELVSGVSGESEQKMRNLFEKARLKAPCVLFLDEVDVITPKRENASKDMERRIVAQLLACLDDLNDEKKSPESVMVIGATNRPDSLDPALRRAGRFDREICMGIPDEKARKRILQVLCRNLRLSQDFDFDKLAHLSPGFVGADLAALAREAAMSAVSRVFNALEKQQHIDGADNNQEKDVDGNSTDPMVGTSEELPATQPEVVENSLSSELMSTLTWLKEQSPLTENQLQELFITMDDFLEALKVVQPSAKREGFATIPDVTWDDIGALHDIRDELKLAILFPLPHSRGSSHGQTRTIRKAYTQAIFAHMMEEAYPMWSKLETETGTELQRTTGILAMGVNKKGYVAEVKNALTSNGMKYTKLNSKDLHDLYDISMYPDSSAIMDPEGGILKSGTALQTYQNQFIKHGGVILDKTELFSLEPGEIIKLHTNRGPYVARSVILCLGPWAGRFLNKLGVQFPLKTTRISVGYFKARIPDQYEVGKFLPFFYDTDSAQFYGIPSYEYPGLVKVALHDGPVIDPDRRDQVENDWAIKICSEFVKDVFPGLEPDPCIVEHCIYTKTPDEHFVLDKLPLHPNLIIGAGFSGHGFKLAPVVGKILGNLAMGKASTYDLSQFRIDRFQRKASL